MKRISEYLVPEGAKKEKKQRFITRVFAVADREENLKIRLIMRIHFRHIIKTASSGSTSDRPRLKITAVSTE